jgi:hypothetical protein
MLSQMCISLHVKYLLFLSGLMKLGYFDKFSKYSQVFNLIKFRPVGSDFHTDGQTRGGADTRTEGRKDGRTDRHDKANNCYSQFCESA